MNRATMQGLAGTAHAAYPQAVAGPGPEPDGRARAIRTYRMADRSETLDFEIRSHVIRAPVTLPHRHEFFQVEANLRGAAHHLISGKRCRYPERSLIFIMPYRVHCAAHEAADPDYYVINFASDFLRHDFKLSPLEMEEASIAQYPELTPFLYEGYVDFVFSESQFAHIRSIIDHLSQFNQNRRLGTLDRIRGAMLELIGFTVEVHADALQALSATRPYMQGRTDALRRVLKFIEEHLQRDISLNEVAEAAFLAPNYLSHLLKKQTGMAFVQWLTAQRLQRSQHLLAHTREKIAAVAHAVGFSDEAYFTRRFRQHFELSPSQYRKAAQSRG